MAGLVSEQGLRGPGGNDRRVRAHKIIETFGMRNVKEVAYSEASEIREDDHLLAPYEVDLVITRSSVCGPR